MNAELPPAFTADGDPRFCSAPTIRAGTCCRPCCTARACRSPSAAARFCWRQHFGVFLGLLAGYFGGKVDALDHAHRRRDPELPHDPAGPSGERYRAGGVSGGGDGRMGADHPDLRHRDSRMGAICPHRSRGDHGGDGQGLRARRQGDRPAVHAASCCGTSCRT